MAELRENHEKLHNPWLVAVWPGMGNVAVTAGYYLMAKLGMHQFAELSAWELFDLEQVEVRNGLIQNGRLPRSRFFVWHDPEERRDLMVFLGEAQPPNGKNALCRQLLQYARDQQVQRVFTFAAMATQMHPSHRARVFAAATDQADLDELSHLDVEILREGQISGLNGVLLGAASKAGIRGSCLLGEMPHIFSQFPFPRASLAVLTVFTALAEIEVELIDLMEEASDMDKELGVLLPRIKESLGKQRIQLGEQTPTKPAENSGLEEFHLAQEDRLHLEHLFAAAQQNRKMVYELKQELDRHGVFSEFEDRFLDLFKDQGETDH